MASVPVRFPDHAEGAPGPSHLGTGEVSILTTMNGVTTQYLVEDDVNPTGLPQVFDKVVSGAVTRTYTYGFQRDSEYQQISNQWTPSFYWYDGGGTVRQLTKSAGHVTGSYEYDVFGNQVNQSGATPNSYLYRGERYDADLGFCYLRARWYNPVTGRFLTRDPSNGSATDPGMLQERYSTRKSHLLPGRIRTRASANGA